MFAKSFCYGIHQIVIFTTCADHTYNTAKICTQALVVFPPRDIFTYTTWLTSLCGFVAVRGTLNVLKFLDRPGDFIAHGGRRASSVRPND